MFALRVAAVHRGLTLGLGAKPLDRREAGAWSLTTECVGAAGLEARPRFKGSASCLARCHLFHAGLVQGGGWSRVCSRCFGLSSSENLGDSELWEQLSVEAGRAGAFGGQSQVGEPAASLTPGSWPGSQQCPGVTPALRDLPLGNSPRRTILKRFLTSCLLDIKTPMAPRAKEALPGWWQNSQS